MKITSEQIAALQQLQERKTGSQEQGTDFADLLSQEINKGQQTEGTSTAASQGMEALNALNPALLFTQSSSEQQLMQKMDNLLEQWENYADQLNSPQSNVRELYTNLQSLSQGLEQTKDEVPTSVGANNPLRDILNELEVMTETETFKINRGDYGA